ncbi:MAG TPA: 4-hydroxy-tetrahydrodipicolinate synthase [Bryobacteraceae bacterium]|nr:4-hydroxy-tetrahydrodipicolinate synthase [Bryobacteraceae bacterium]
MFTGCGTAIVTPFRQDQSLDETALRALVNRQIEAKIDCLIPCGTTGESPTLTHEEHLRVVEITVQEARGRVPVLAGAGGNNTEKVVPLIRELKELGVSGILSVTPYYNKPTQEGLYQHYKRLAEASSLPLVIYNVPGRTQVNVEPATLARLAEIPNIVGVKESSGNIAQISNILARVPGSFTVWAGDDVVALPAIALGARGVISVVANEIPAEFGELARAAVRGDFAKARELQRKYHPLIDINFVETSPGPVKFAMAQMGLLQPVWRLPMVPPQQASQEKIEAVLQGLGLLAGVHV